MGSVLCLSSNWLAKNVALFIRYKIHLEYIGKLLFSRFSLGVKLFSRENLLLLFLPGKDKLTK